MAAPKLNPPFRAEHLGSLLRPQYILDARKKLDDGQLAAAELKKLEDRAIADALRMQREVGLKSLTDGEYRYPICNATHHLDGYVLMLVRCLDVTCNLPGVSITLAKRGQGD